MRSLRGRVRLLIVGLTVMFGVTALLAVSRLRVLETSVTDVLSRNYRSIEAADGIGRVIAALRLAVGDGRVASAGPGLQMEFDRLITIEHNNYTETGEPELAQAVDQRGRALFDVALAGASAERLEADAAAIQRDLEALIALNRNAMFAADRRTRVVANRLLLGTVGALFLSVLLAAGVGWTLSSAVTRPLTELAERLRGVGRGGPYPTLGPQPLAELQQVADEYDRMARRLEEFERLNVTALLAEKTKTEAVIEASEDGLIVIDPSGAVVHVNEVACAILHLDRHALLGTRFEDLSTSQPHYLRIRESVRAFLAHPDREPGRITLTLFLRGRDHHYILRPTPFRTRDGSHAGIILVLQDVTYLRDQEGRREQLVATLSHELGTPLTSLSMALELLGRGAPTPAQCTLLEAAREDVGRLQDVAQRLLDLSRLRATSIALERRNVDLGEIIQRLIKIFTLQAQEKGIALETAKPPLGLVITGDATKLSWALSNLLANALRYTPAGGRVRVEATPQPDTVLVSVEDSGPGIPADQRERIFEPFAQSAASGDIGGAGLGLAIVRDIVQAHGGRVHLESAVGHGSRFMLELPRG